MNISVNTVATNYGEETVEAMHEIAQLIYITRAVREIRDQFLNAPGFAWDEASPQGNEILKVTREASQELLAAVLGGKTHAEISSRVDGVRRAYAGDFERLTRDAKSLADMETEAFGGKSASGNWVRTLVLKPLMNVAERWSA